MQKIAETPTEMKAELRSVVESFDGNSAATLTERLYLALRHAILVGDLLPYTKLPEKDLTSILPVSRTPLREALRRLEAEELVTSLPNRGVMVRGTSLRDLLEVYETLEILEAHAAELAADRVDDEVLNQLQTHLDLAEFYAKRHRWEDTTAQSVEFHTLLYKTAGNRRLSKVIGELREITHSFRRYRLRSDEEFARGLAEHRAVFDALLERNGQSAARSMGSHVASSTRLVREAIEQVGRDDEPYSLELFS
jgi:DNA-binding GntR family transcriptional regulator